MTLVSEDRRPGAAVITLDSPDNRNALSKPLIESLRSALDRAAADTSVRIAVLTATGPTFCAGVDLTDPPMADGPGSYAGLLGTLWEYPKPVVAAINGHARAGGLGLVAAADVAIAVQSATFAFTEVRLGLVPAVVSVVCLQKMTPTAAARYLLTGEQFDASAAQQSGLVGQVVADGSLAAAVDAVVEEFRLCEPAALVATKSLLRRVPEMTVRDGIDEAARVSREFFGSAESAEGIAAFRDRRPPRWATPS